MADDLRAEIIGLLDRIDARGQKSLRDFAAFIAERYPAESTDRQATTLAEPKHAPRPDNESVIKAIKRLSDCYPMIDRDSVFNKTSALMTAHVMQGRAAEEVIDELEALFAAEYEKLKQQFDTASAKD